MVDLGLANLVKDARKVGTILDFQETATVRYLVEFKEPKRRGIRTPATIDEYLITVLFDVAPINLCPGDGDTVKDPPVSEEPQRTPEVPIITKDFFVVIIALYPARHITNDASAWGKTDFFSFGDESVDHLILETPGEDVVVALNHERRHG